MNIRELSALAGVSPATVSLVLNNKKGVGQSTRKRVLKLAEEYNYSLTSKFELKNILFIKHIKHGMIVEENAGFISAIMDSVENDCRAQGYSLNIVLSENGLENTLSSINFGLFYGIIVLGTELDECSYPLLETIPIPYIVIDNIMPHFPCSSIAIDNFDIVYGALLHLKSLGHQKIAYFKSNIKIQNFEERAAAFYKYAQELNFEFHSIHEFPLSPTLLGSFQSCCELLKSHPALPSCAFADNDTIAIGAIKALKKSGYKIPEDISVIGFDDIPFAAINSPTLSTMSVPKRSIGSLALLQLHNLIENNLTITAKTRVGGNLVTRHSTAPAVRTAVSLI